MATTVSVPIPTPPLTPPPPQSGHQDTTVQETPSSQTTRKVSVTDKTKGIAPIPSYSINDESIPSSTVVRHIDSLLEIYLENLDQYSRLREQLSKNLSSGFLSIAHANRTTTTGRRYGEECYDERMKAGRRVRIVGGEGEEGEEGEEGGEGREKKEEELIAPKPASLSNLTEGEGESGGKGQREQDATTAPGKANRTPPRSTTTNFESPLPTFAIISLSHDSPPRCPSETTKKTTQPREGAVAAPPPASPLRSEERPGKPERSEKLTNPLYQFGILTPPSLRTAQNLFTAVLLDENARPQSQTQTQTQAETRQGDEAWSSYGNRRDAASIRGEEEGKGRADEQWVQGTIPELINVMGRMRWLEREIERCRGLLVECTHERTNERGST